MHNFDVKIIFLNVKKSFKAAFLYIGTAIGAGFSSGREIALFFGESSPFNVALSALFMALLAGFFMFAGKFSLLPRGHIVKFGIFFSAGISLCSMLAGGEFVLASLTGIPMLGLVMAILGGCVVSLGIEKIKLLNAVLVPLIVLSVSLIFFKLDGVHYTLPFSLSKPILYSGLDLLLGGVVISEEGKKLKSSEIILSSVIIGAFLFLMLFMLQSVVLHDEMHSSMPVLAVSEKFGLKPVCGVLVGAAIFTTLVSSLKIVSDSVRNAASKLFERSSEAASKNNRALFVFLSLLVAYPLSFFGFDNIVDAMYPIMSWCGVALAFLTLLKLLARLFLAFRHTNKKSCVNRLSV